MAIKIKEMQGFVADGTRMCGANVTARFTSDGIGETLSLQAGGMMIGVPFEEIRPLAREARKHGQQGKGKKGRA